MTDGIAAVVPEAPVRASVKWYDAGGGYGFLAPEDGAGDIFCHAMVLEAVGLVRLPAGATVFCEVVPGRSGPQVSRIHGVDFRTASSAPLSVDEETGSGHPAPASRSLPVGRRVRALVKWFMPLKGYGFLEPVDGSVDLFCHLGVVRAAGLETLPQGAPVSCEAVQGERGAAGVADPERRCSCRRGRRERAAARYPASRSSWDAAPGGRPGDAGHGQVLSVWPEMN